MKEQILDILERISATDEVKSNPDIMLFDEGLLDSLGLIELLICLEEEMGIKIDPTEIDRKDIDTPNKLVEYIIRKKQR